MKLKRTAKPCKIEMHIRIRIENLKSELTTLQPTQLRI